LTGSVFYILHHMIVKTNLFLISGVSGKAGGSFELAKLGGFYRSNGLLAILFFIPAFSLAGFPPLSGFWAKMILIRAGLEIQSYAVAATAAAVGLLTLYSMTKIWGEVFWKPTPKTTDSEINDKGQAANFWRLFPIIALAMLTITIGLAPEFFLKMAGQAAHELLNPDIYVKAVLGEL
jgi:multicomponent Na+:H+ antiporter subunit D